MGLTLLKRLSQGSRSQREPSRLTSGTQGHGLKGVSWWAEQRPLHRTYGPGVTSTLDGKDRGVFTPGSV